MRFAICNELFEGWSWSRVCQFAASLGYDGVELAPFTIAPDVREISQADRARLRQEAAAAGVSIAGLHWLLVSPPGIQLLSPDAGARRAGQDYLTALVHLSGDLGAPVMVLGSPKQRSYPTDMSPSHAAGLFRDLILPVADAAADRGVTICLEPLPAPDTNFMNTLSDAAEVASTLAHPAIAVILDMRSMGMEAAPVPELIRKYAPLARHVHANDINMRGPGDGPTDLVPIFRALVDSHYDGAVSVEVFDFTPDPETIARNSLAAMHSALAEASR